jgi:hypothetical protein
MHKTLTAISLTASTLLACASRVLAQGTPPGVTPGATNETDSIFGTIEAPEGVAKYNAAAVGETGSDIGLVLFLSNIIRIATIAAGIWVMVNFILAGWAYITSTGDSKAHSDASSKMTYSLTGLAIIVGAYTLAALIGLVFFGDASYILNPQIVGVGSQL